MLLCISLNRRIKKTDKRKKRKGKKRKRKKKKREKGKNHGIIKVGKDL